MFQGSPFDTPAQWNGREDAESRGTLEAEVDRCEPEFSSEGWRGNAAIAFAVAPGIVFLVVVLLNVLGRG